MFEELTPNQAGQEVPDMFEKVDPIIPPQQQPVQSAPVPPVPSESKLGLILAIVGGVVVIALIVFLGYKIFSSVKEVKDIQAPVVQESEDVVTPEVVVPETTPEVVTPEVVVPEVVAPEVNTNIDSDGDGITDTDETALGTNPNSLDTDSDGLFDNEEVNIYKTNPTNPDTDGDTFVDGQEISNGYNPNGPGRLFNVNQ